MEPSEFRESMRNLCAEHGLDYEKIATPVEQTITDAFSPKIAVKKNDPQRYLFVQFHCYRLRFVPSDQQATEAQRVQFPAAFASRE